MTYQIMFYGGMAGALLALILSIFLYIKLNIPQIVKDLTGFSLPRIVGRQQRAGAERATGKITNEIMPRKDVDVSGAEKTVHMANETAPGHKKDKQHTATWPLGGRTSQANTIAPTTLLSPGETTILEVQGESANQQGAGETTILEGIKETVLLQRVDKSILDNAAIIPEQKSTETTQLAVDETTALAQDETTVLAQAETTILSVDETTVLAAMEETMLLTAAAEEPCQEPELDREPEPEPAFQKEVDIMIIHSAKTI